MATDGLTGLMNVLAVLHRFGLNAAIVAGLILMPTVVAVGYWADSEVSPADRHFILRGSFDDTHEAEGGSFSVRDAMTGRRR